MIIDFDGFIYVVALAFSSWALYKGVKSKKEYVRLKAQMQTPVEK